MREGTTPALGKAEWEAESKALASVSPRIWVRVPPPLSTMGVLGNPFNPSATRFSHLTMGVIKVLTS